MSDRLEMDWPRALTYALAIAVVATLLIAAATSTAAFGLFNPSWDGATEFRVAVADDPATDSAVVRDPSAYDAHSPDETTAFVIAPDSTYDPAAADRIAQFVERGGTLVVLDNRGVESNALLEAVGAQARLDGRVVRDERHHEQGPLLPTATTVSDRELADDAERLTLNHATVIDVGTEPLALEQAPADRGEPTTLATTSAFAQLEPRSAEHQNEADNSSAPSATYRVATTESVGDGRVVVVADPSITINAMVDRSDNEAFLHALHADTDTVVFDRSHAGDLPPLASALETIRRSPTLQALIGVGSIVAVGVTPSRRVRRALVAVRDRLAIGSGVLTGVSTDTGVDRSHERSDAGLSAAEQAGYLRRHHPDWSDDRIEEIIGKFNHNDGEYTVTDE
ncbi:DUF4350 domain-containing protein [Salinadaptatus halalkaliphilus]|uniref:DUF4350 domain-containing protein n=1 Tax=Salinadaptatus halalkaliphilus TaxID=2419781 RepID=A0A4S3TN46_9EURY|nr:DUF4350 domain-containing protein [Salinadaptatus halalkaliphilus]THE65050.1 DUF4350 domain-containing protein [Salinadaptatus halalkaliphilus]